MITQYMERREKLPIREGFEVIVAGGGVSGVAAALAAARQGRKTLLLEKSVILGGLATQGIVNYWVPMCNGRGRQIVKGMAEELLRLSIRYGFDTLPDAWKSGEPKEPTTERYTTRFSIGLFALALFELLEESGVEILYDATVSEAVMDGAQCLGVIVQSKSGRCFIPAEVLIDATGDAELLSRAGVPCRVGENYYTTFGEGIDLAHCEEAVRTGCINRAYFWMMGGKANLYGKNHPEGVPMYRGDTLEGINRFVKENQTALLSGLKGQERFARDLHLLPGIPQLRTVRCIAGEYALKEEDRYRHFDDSIGAIPDFDHRDILYEVPYRTLYHGGYTNLLTCGRSASARGYAWDVLRVIPPAVLTGQAAGIAAAVAVQEKKPVGRISISRVQKLLSDTGVLIHFEDDWIPKTPASDQSEPLPNHL